MTQIVEGVQFKLTGLQLEEAIPEVRGVFVSWLWTGRVEEEELFWSDDRVVGSALHRNLGVSKGAFSAKVEQL